MTRLNAEIEEETYGEWKEHAEESTKYSSMTHMIRTAMDNQIRIDEGNLPLKSDTPSGRDIETDIIPEINNLRETIQREINSLKSDIENLRRQVDIEDKELVMRLADDCMDLMPTLSGDNTKENLKEGARTAEDFRSWFVDDFHEDYPYDRDEATLRRVEQALSVLETSVPKVKEDVIDGESYYYREVESEPNSSTPTYEEYKDGVVERDTEDQDRKWR